MTIQKKILIIDDEQDVITYLSAVLKSADYMTYSADSARAGFEKLREVEPDLVCLDIMMPKESGISFYARMKKDKRFEQIPVLVISGVIQEEEYDFHKFLPEKSIPPPQEYIEKPIKLENFLKTVQRLLEKDAPPAADENV